MWEGIIIHFLKGTTNKHYTRSRHGQWWHVNGANVEIFSNCFCMHWNFTWIDYLHALMTWEGFWTKIWLTHPLVSIINSSIQCGPLFNNIPCGAYERYLYEQIFLEQSTSMVLQEVGFPTNDLGDFFQIGVVCGFSQCKGIRNISCWVSDKGLFSR